MSLTDGPVFIRSKMSTSLALGVTSHPPAGDVAFTAAPAGDWNLPQSQWVLRDVGSGFYQIYLFASDGLMVLEAGGATAGSSIQLAPPNPNKPELQLWMFEDASDNQFITLEGAPGMALGFDQDSPIEGLELKLNAAANIHDKGDQFNIKLVAY